MAEKLRAVTVLRPILIGRRRFTQGTIAVPVALAQTMIASGAARPSDGETVDFEIADARQYFDHGLDTAIKAGDEAYRSSDEIREIELHGLVNELSIRTENLSQQIGAVNSKIEGLIDKKVGDFFGSAEADLKIRTELLDEALNSISDRGRALEAAIDNTEGGQQALAKLVSTQAGDVLAKKYQDRADSQAWKIVVWQIVTLVSIVSWGISVAYRIAMLGDGSAETASVRLMSLAINLDWPGALMLALQNGPFIASASFAAVQVSRHHSTEQVFRKLSLELNLIDQYVNTLPLEQQHEIKKNFADRFFLGSGVSSSQV